MSGLSIVVPTWGREDLVEELLGSIADDVETVAFPVEVLLVDDSPEPAAGWIRALAAQHGAAVVEPPTASVGGKRNYGLSRAAHDLILFLDSDVRVLPGTIAAHHRRLAQAPEDVAGCLGLVRFVGEQTFAWQVIEAMQLTLPFSYPAILEQVPWGPTANLSVRRAAFHAVGGFDTTLPRYGGEDVDLGLRLTRKGMRIVTTPDAVAEHSIETWSGWGQNLSRLWSFGLADYHLLERHPDRGFVDFPTGPILWAFELVVVAALLWVDRVSPVVAASAMLASILAYPLVYAALKRQHGASLLVHLPGPLVFWTMDLAKAKEALRRGRPGLILRRLKFLDDLIAQDWREVAASAWGLSASMLLFVAVLLLASGGAG